MRLTWPLLAFVFSLWFCSAGRASYGVALILGSQDESLTAALEARHFVTKSHAKVEREERRFLLEHFAKTVPERGVAFVYLAEGDEDLADLLKWLRDDSAAAFSMVIVNGDRDPELEASIVAESSMICWTAPGFAESFTEHLSDPAIELPTAIRDAVAMTGGWSSPIPTKSMPLIRSPFAPPDKVLEGRAVGDEWVSPLGTVFCWCPPGSFTRSGPEGPVEVSIPRGFWLGKYEMTKREFDLVTRKNPRHAIASLPSHPRDGIRHDDIMSYVNQLNGRSRFSQLLPDEWEYALPSELEWEYACRAGTQTPFYFGKDESRLPDHANFADLSLFESGDDYYHYANRLLDDGAPFLAVVGTYPPNPWGFHDMYGNLWEWTSSYEIDEMNQGIPVARGGSWVSLENDCGTHARRHFDYRTERNFIGFRLMLRPRHNH